MVDQFSRRFRVEVDRIAFDALDINFTAVRTLDKNPNTLELQIYNLNPDHRAYLSAVSNPIVQLSAGYDDNMGVIFLGDVREVSSAQDGGSDWVTTLSSGDGERATRFDRINKSFAAGTPIPTVISSIADELDLGLGNLNEATKKGSMIDAAFETQFGIVVSGSAKRQLTRLTRSAGLEWSVQNGELQVLEAGKTLGTTAVVLTPTTGLIGSPAINNEGVCEFTALLNPNIIPGRQIHIDSATIDSVFRVERVTFYGQSAGGAWYVEVEASEVKT